MFLLDRRYVQNSDWCTFRICSEGGIQEIRAALGSLIPNPKAEELRPKQQAPRASTKPKPDVSRIKGIPVIPLKLL